MFFLIFAYTLVFGVMIGKWFREEELQTQADEAMAGMHKAVAERDLLTRQHLGLGSDYEHVTRLLREAEAYTALLEARLRKGRVVNGD